MRIQLVLCASLVLPSCLWTDFDDLKEDTWVHSTGKPDNAATNWAVALQGGARAEGARRLAVLGASASIYNEIAIDPSGEVTFPTEVELAAEFAIGTLALEPLFIADPAGRIALVTGTGGDAVTTLVTDGGPLTAEQAFGPKIPSAATFMTPPLVAGGVGPSQTLVAENDVVYGTVFEAGTGFVQPECKLADEAGGQISIRALGAIRNGMTDDVVVLADTGKLMLYNGTVFNGCGTTEAPIAGKSLDIGFAGAISGSQILTFSDDTGLYALVQAHDDEFNGHLGLYKLDGAAIEAVGAPVSTGRLRTAALLDGIGSAAKRYVAAGYPDAVIDGVQAGQVQLYEVSTASGVNATAAATLHDAQPGSDQSFGRSVTALPFNGKTILAVAADNDVFLYFRTTLYDETRQGR